jgi:hypothetical protein
VLDLAVLLECEGVHRQHAVMACDVVRPCGQYAVDAFEHALNVAGDVVEGMRHVQRDQVARMAHEQFAELRLRKLVVVWRAAPPAERSGGPSCERGHRPAHRTRGRARS